MRAEIFATAAAGCICLVAMSIPADSRPVKRGVEAPRAIAGPAAKKTRPVRRIKIRGVKPSIPPNARAAGPAAAIGHAGNSSPASISGPPATAYRRPMFGWPALVVEARKYIGTNPTKRSRLWCATFMNFVLAKVGYAGTGSDAARSFASYGRRVSAPQVGAIAVLTRGKRGGHVGVVTGIDVHGNPIIVSGNHGRQVAESAYPRRRIIAYVMPVGTPQPTRYAALASQASAPRADLDIGAGLISPIAELLKAINEETPPRAVRAAQPIPRARPVPPRAAPPPAPQRVVQQIADSEPQVRDARLAPPQRLASRSAPLDPALARLLGIEGR